MTTKATALLLLLGVFAAAADDAVLPQATVFAALQVTPEVSEYWQTLSWFPDVAEMVGNNFTGTVFAPINEAWNTITKATREAGIPLTTDSLKDIVLYHIIPGRPITISVLNDDQNFVSALAGKKVTARYADGKLTLEGIGSGAQIVRPDINVGPAGSSVVHVIDTVLLPFKLPGATEKPTAATDKPAAGKPAEQDNAVKATSIVDDAAETGSGALKEGQQATDTAVDASQQATGTVPDAVKNAMGMGSGEGTPCPLNYLPVCGTNGKTYGNECAANADEQDIECEGKCPCAAPLIAGAPSLAPSVGPPTAPSPRSGAIPRGGT